MSRLDYSQLLFGDKLYRRSIMTMGTGGDMQTVTGISGGNAQTRYGVAVADSANGYLDVLLDGDTQSVSIPCDEIINEGDRVCVIICGNSVKVMPITARIIDKAYREAVAESERLVGDVNKAFDEYKAEHKLTDDDITSEFTQTKTELSNEISGALDEGGALYSSWSALNQTVDGIQTQVGEALEADSHLLQRMSTVEQTSTQLQTTVTTLDEQVGEVSSQVTQTSTELTAKFDTLDSNVSSMIRQNAEGINVGYDDGSADTQIAPSGTSFNIDGVPYIQLVPNRGASLITSGDSDFQISRSGTTGTTGIAIHDGWITSHNGRDVPLSEPTAAVNPNSAQIYGAVCVFVNDSGLATATLSIASSKFRWIDVLIKTPGGQSIVVRVAVGTTGHYVISQSGATTYVYFGQINVSGLTVSLPAQLRMPVSAWQFGSGSNANDCRITKVWGWR